MLFLTSELMGCAFSSADITGDGMKINIIKELAKGGFSTVRNNFLPELWIFFIKFTKHARWKACKIFIMIFRSPVIHIHTHLYSILTFFFFPTFLSYSLLKSGCQAHKWVWIIKGRFDFLKCFMYSTLSLFIFQVLLCQDLHNGDKYAVKKIETHSKEEIDRVMLEVKAL